MPRRSMRLLLPSMCVLLLAAVAAKAEEDAPEDKRQYTLFNPVPDSLMRPMATDRPDATESPSTVDAGHVQIELDFFVYTRDRETVNGQDTRFRVFNVMPFNVRIGLNHNTELDIIFEPLVFQRTEFFVIPPFSVEREGFGDTTLRIKRNLWGNDGGDTAFAILGFITLPTNQDDIGIDSAEGGIILPFSKDLEGAWSFGAQLEFDVVRNLADTGFEAGFSQTAVIGYEVSEQVGAFLEIFSFFTSESAFDWIGTVNLGFTWAITADVQLDLGIRVGISSAAPDSELFVGGSFRF